ncbi:hypothetical protein AHiyo4_27200 [Arthrobacter sp. Hiyo4]|nr:hypothetical protein AHiyo4_27200 [Arthrobacter sp. Hiyo4]
MITDAFLMVPFARVEPGDWDWAALGTIATALAAVVTAITVVFVARQTSATRKAAEEAERSADAANKALDYAQTQLDFSRQQHLQSLYMTAEAVKSRIDAEMPRLVLEEATVLPEATVDGGALCQKLSSIHSIARNRLSTSSGSASRTTVREPPSFFLANM